jgi:TolC family type I secretion outer membrane protein
MPGRPPGAPTRARRPLAAALLSAALAIAPAPTARAQAPPPAPPPPATSPRPALPPGQVLTLPAAVALALEVQPTIRQARFDQSAADARIPQARSAYYPTLDWVSAASRGSTFSQTLNRAITGNQISTALQANQIIYDFGKTGALVDEAKARLRQADSEVERIREVTVFNVKQAYYQLLQARRLVKVADDTFARAELNLRSARGFFDVGTKPKSDVTRAEVEVANARVNQIRARNLVQFNQVALANAIGLEATAVFDIEDVLNFEPAPLDPEALRAEALANRPELAQAKARVDAALAQVAGAKARFLPTLSANGAYGFNTPDDPPLHEQWEIGAQLSWNLFEGFFSVARLDETRALVESARANYDSLDLQVRLDVEQAYIAVVNAAETIAANQKALESAQENLRLAQGRYDAGVGTILDLTDAQLALTTAEADQVRALTDHKVGLAQLDRVVGRP